VSHNEHDFPLHINELVRSTTNENPMIHIEVIYDDDEESDDESIDLSEDEENYIIEEDDSDDN